MSNLSFYEGRMLELMGGILKELEKMNQLKEKEFEIKELDEETLESIVNRVKYYIDLRETEGDNKEILELITKGAKDYFDRNKQND